MSDILLDSTGHGPSANGGVEGLIKDATTATFMADVIEESKNQPVLVDFWAPWCGPCKQLTPILEKAVQAAGGAVKLVKVNVDENQAISSQLGVQSIPAVFAFKDGRPLDGFSGALPESQVKSFIEKISGPIGPTPVEATLQAAQDALEAGDIQNAAQAFAAVLKEDNQNADSLGGLARCYLALGDLDHARQTLDMAGPDIADRDPVAHARAALDVAEQAANVGDIAPLQAALEADANDHQARFDLAVALNARGDRAGATDQLIALIGRKKDWNEDAARKQILQFFEAWGATDPDTISGRRKLSAVLFS